MFTIALLTLYIYVYIYVYIYYVYVYFLCIHISIYIYSIVFIVIQHEQKEPRSSLPVFSKPQNQHKSSIFRSLNQPFSGTFWVVQILGFHKEQIVSTVLATFRPHFQCYNCRWINKETMVMFCSR